MNTKEPTVKCVLCSMNIHISDFDIGYAFEAINPITFRMANMHSACYEDALESAKEIPCKKPGYQNRYDEYITTKL